MHTRSSSLSRSAAQHERNATQRACVEQQQLQRARAQRTERKTHRIGEESEPIAAQQRLGEGKVHPEQRDGRHLGRCKRIVRPREACSRIHKVKITRFPFIHLASMRLP
jgi:hypothetical protein